MSKSGRYGKYGETKRFERLRSSLKTPELWKGRGPRFAFRKSSKESKLRIRIAKPSDFNFVRHLSREAFHQYGPYEDLLPRWFRKGLTRTLVSVMGKEPVGFAMLGQAPQQRYASDTCELIAIAVESSKRRLGIGDRLLAEVLRNGRALGFENIVLHTARDNHLAQRLFSKRGFRPGAVKEQFYPSGQDALMMYRSTNEQQRDRDPS